MKASQKVGFFLFFFLIIYWICILFLTIFLVKIGIAGIFFFNDGAFYFKWQHQLVDSGRIGFFGGIPIGIGSWVLSKMEETKRKKEKAQEDKKE